MLWVFLIPLHPHPLQYSHSASRLHSAAHIKQQIKDPRADQTYLNLQDYSKGPRWRWRHRCVTSCNFSWSGLARPFLPQGGRQGIQTEWETALWWGIYRFGVVLFVGLLFLGYQGCVKHWNSTLSSSERQNLVSIALPWKPCSANLCLRAPLRLKHLSAPPQHPPPHYKPPDLLVCLRWLKGVLHRKSRTLFGSSLDHNM